jgi:hypothetical protein
MLHLSRNDVLFLLRTCGVCLINGRNYLNVYLPIVVSNTYCVVVFSSFSSSSSCVPYVASFSGFSIVDCSFGIL